MGARFSSTYAAAASFAESDHNSSDSRGILRGKRQIAERPP